MEKYHVYAIESGIIAHEFETKSVNHICRTIVNYGGASAKYEGWLNDMSLQWHIQLNGEEINISQFITKENYHTFLN